MQYWAEAKQTREQVWHQQLCCIWNGFELRTQPPLSEPIPLTSPAAQLAKPSEDTHPWRDQDAHVCTYPPAATRPLESSSPSWDLPGACRMPDCSFPPLWCVGKSRHSIFYCHGCVKTGLHWSESIRRGRHPAIEACRSAAREGAQPCQASLQRGTESLSAASKEGRGMLHFIRQQFTPFGQRLLSTLHQFLTFRLPVPVCGSFPYGIGLFHP